jgi:hypothetical protein
VTARVLASVWIRLDEAALCLEDGCETLYRLGEPACPRCASRAFALLAQWLSEKRREEYAQQQGSGDEG